MLLNREISDELKVLSEVVAGISQVTPYDAPTDGYFETLPELILRRIQRSAEEPVLSIDLQRLTKAHALQEIPDGYFDNFAARMLAKVKSQTMAEAGPEASAAEELAAISPLLSKLGKKTPFEVPDGYFNQSITIPSIPSVLIGLQDIPTYQVPDGYFDSLPSVLVNKVNTAIGQIQNQTTRTQAPVIQMTNRPRKQSFWWRMPTAAVAASVIIVVSLLTLPTFNTTKTSYSNTNPDITKNLTNTTEVSDQDLQNFLEDQDEHNADQLVGNTTALLDISETDVKSMLGEVSDAELKEYADDQKIADDLPMN